MSFLYHLSVKFLEPTSLCLIFLLAAACLRKRKVPARVCFWLPVAILLVCGNGQLSGWLTRHLEMRCPALEPTPSADCLLVLAGGTLNRIPPRPTIEVNDKGDRVLYAAYLYRQGKAPWVICTGGTGERRPAAEDMAELLQSLGVPQNAILVETKAMNTREHARNLNSLLRTRSFSRVLLVTSALHMPRSLGVFRRLCPGIEFIPAPTDFRTAEPMATPWYRRLITFVPTPKNLLIFSEAMHEYVGMLYYTLRGWM